MSLEQPNGKKSGRIQSLERAATILEEVSRHENGITLSDLSRNLSLHTSTLYHLTRTLVGCGFLKTAENSKRYKIGRAIYALAASSFGETELCSIAAPYLEQLAQEAGESSHLAVWERDQVMILARASGTNAFQINERAGLIRPTYCTAIGKAMLSGLDEKEFARKTENIEFKQITSNTLRSIEELRLQVLKARADGVAFDDCEYNAEARCIAVTVKDFRGAVVAAIGFSGPKWRLSLAETTELVPITKDIASRLSDELGSRGVGVAQ